MKTWLAGGTLIVLGIAASFAASVPGESQTQATGEVKQASPSPTVHANSSVRKIPCKTPENAAMCYWTHGRLSLYNGNPALRIWKIGAGRILGVYNGPSHFPPRTNDDNENPELPSRLDRVYAADRRRWEKEGSSDYGQPDIFADFEVCPLEPEKPGWMQAVCVESATKVFVDKGWR